MSRQLVKRALLGALVPMSAAVMALEAKAVPLYPPNAGDPVGNGGNPTFPNPYAQWAYSTFSTAESIYPFTPYTTPGCDPNTGNPTSCDDLNFVYDNTNVVWAGNASVDTGSAYNPIATIDQSTTLPNVNEPYNVGNLKGGAPGDGQFVMGYVFGPEAISATYGGASVNRLGFFADPTFTPTLRASHKVALWEWSGSTADPLNPVKLAEVTFNKGDAVGGGTGTCSDYADLFCWITLATPVSLSDAKFYTIGAYGGFSAGTPGPLPLLGAASAFGLSRRLRNRVRIASVNA